MCDDESNDEQPPDTPSDDEEKCKKPRPLSPIQTTGTALEQVRKLVSDEHFERFLKQEFDKYDANGDGRLEFSEIRPLLEVLCVMISKNCDTKMQTPSRTVLFEKFKTYNSGERAISREHFSRLLRDVLYVAIDTAAQSDFYSTGSPQNALRAAPGTPQMHVFQCMKPFSEDAGEKKLRLIKEAQERKEDLFGELQVSGETNWQDLSALQNLFQTLNEANNSGLTQKEFIRLFTSSTGKTTKPFQSNVNPLKLFQRLQTDDLVRWDRFSTFLVSCEEVFEMEENPTTLHLSDNCATRKIRKHLHHKTSICQIIAHTELERYFTASTDSIVKSWCSSTLEYETTIFDPGTVSVIISALLILPHNGSLLVCRNDRIFHLYTCSFEGTSLAHTYMAAPYLERGLQTREYFIGENPFDCNVGLEGRLNGGVRDLSHRVDKFMLIRRRCKGTYCAMPELTDIVTAVCSVGIVVKNVEDGIVAVGLDSGKMLLLGLVTYGAVASTLLNAKVHKGEITSVSCLTDRRCILTSSVDHTINVFNVDKECVVTSIAVGNMQTNNKFGGVVRFAYDINLQMSAFTTGANKVSIGSLAQPGCITLSDHKSLVTDLLWIDDETKMPLSCNKRLTYLVTLSGADKTIKVWETTNFTCIQTIIDKKKRIGAEDRLGGMAYDKATRRLLVGCSSHLVAYSLHKPVQSDTASQPLGEVSSGDPVTVGSVLSTEETRSAVGAEKETQKPSKVALLQRFVKKPQGKERVARGVPPVLHKPGILLHSEDHSHIIACDEDTLCTWDVRTGEVSNIFNLPDVVITHAALYPSKERLLVLIASKPLFSATQPVRSQLTLWDCRFSLKAREFLPSKEFEFAPILCVSAFHSHVLAGWGCLTIWREDPEDVEDFPVVSPSQTDSCLGRGDVVDVAWADDVQSIAVVTSSSAVMLYRCDEGADTFTLKAIMDLSMTAHSFAASVQQKEIKDVSSRFGVFRTKMAKPGRSPPQAKSSDPERTAIIATKKNVSGLVLGFLSRVKAVVRRQQHPTFLSPTVMLSPSLGNLVVLWLHGRATAFFAGGVSEEAAVTCLTPCVSCSATNLGVACADSAGVVSLFDLSTAVDNLEVAHKLGQHNTRTESDSGQEPNTAAQTEDVRHIISFKAHDSPIRAMKMVLAPAEIICTLSEDGIKLHRRNGIPVTIFTTTPTEEWPIKVTPRGSAIIKFYHTSASSTDAQHHTRRHAVRVRCNMKLSNTPSATAAALVNEVTKNTAPSWENENALPQLRVGGDTCDPHLHPLKRVPRSTRIIEATSPIVHIPCEETIEKKFNLPNIRLQQPIWSEPIGRPIPGLPLQLLP